ncbi:MAG: cytochrome-c peroxidase, partial [Gemmatimonadales bacterium]
LQAQAMAPLLDPAEMAAPSVAALAERLRRAPYAPAFARLFGAGTVARPDRLVDEATFAVGRYELEDPAFHPYSSKYDAWLEGKARLSGAELRGLRVFEDSTRGNCAGCHLDRPGTDGRPPMFTDYQYEALGVPRNLDLHRDQDPHYHDLGLCGPIRADLDTATEYCGMFRTPSLRNVATRQVFFHNGVYHSLEQVLKFYAFRDTRPDSVYGIGVHGAGQLDDLPGTARANLDVRDPPFGRRVGDLPPLSAADIRDLIAFLGTLTDGYEPGH